MKKVHSFRLDTDAANVLNAATKITGGTKQHVITTGIYMYYNHLLRERQNGHAETQHQQAP